MNYFQNYPKFMVSLLKTIWGAKATKENDFGYGWMPGSTELLVGVHVRRHVPRLLDPRGGQGARPRGSDLVRDEPGRTGPNTKKIIAALAKLKWLVLVENVETETAQFWKAPAEYGAPETAKIPTE